MENHKKLVETFSDSLGIEAAEVTDTLSYGTSKWDSVAHMALVAAIETNFDIMMDTNDIIDMSNFAKAKEIIGKYGITFNTSK